jgi:uncharacterized protein YaaR (DUF327 family)
MNNFSRSVLIGTLVSGVLLAGHALYFNSLNVALADGLVFLFLAACWSYLLNRAAGDEQPGRKNASTSDDLRYIQESNAFHTQLGNEMSDQLNSAHTELGNTQAILSDAIVKLVSNFIAISDGVRDLSEHTSNFSKQVRQMIEDVRTTLVYSGHFTDGKASSDANSMMLSNQQIREMLEDFVGFNEIVTQNAMELNAINTKVEQNVLVVISTLQFQDMSSQLIEHARMRMTALQEIANEMGKGGDSLTHREYLEQIAAYNRLLQKHVMSLDRKKANPVAQKDFGTGDVELF